MIESADAIRRSFGEPIRIERVGGHVRRPPISRRGQSSTSADVGDTIGQALRLTLNRTRDPPAVSQTETAVRPGGRDAFRLIALINDAGSPRPPAR